MLISKMNWLDRPPPQQRATQAFFLLSFLFLNKKNLLGKSDLNGLAALSSLVSCDHQQLRHIIPFMNSSSAILKPFAAIGLPVCATLVDIRKDIFSGIAIQVPYHKNMFLMAKKPCRKSFKRLRNKYMSPYSWANKTNASLGRTAVRSQQWIPI